MRLGGAERDDRHAELHRLEQRQAERGPADRVQVDATPRHRLVQLALRQVLDAADAGGVDPEQVERRLAGEAAEQVRAGHAPAAACLVDDDGRARELAGVPVAGVDDAVLDHARRRRAGVPEQRVEVRDVDEQQVRPVGGGVAHLGDPALRRVVLDVDGREVAAAQPLRREPLELVRALEHDDVEVLVAPGARAAARSRCPASRTCARGRPRPARGRAAPARRTRARPWTKAVVHAPWTCQSRILTPAPPHERQALDGGDDVGHLDPAQARVPGDRAGRGRGSRRTGRRRTSSSCGTLQGRQRTAGTVGA